MAFEVTMPQMGADMTEGTLVRWLKNVGDHVERGDIIAEIETDKANVELEAFETGDIIKRVVEEGEVVPVGEVIALLGEKGEAAPQIERMPPAQTPASRVIEKPEEQEAAAPAPPQSAPQKQSESPTLEQAETGPEPEARPAEPALARAQPTGDGRVQVGAREEERVRISPVARRIASQAGIDLHTVRGSGPDGRILRRDVEAAMSRETGATAAPPAPAPEVQPAPPRQPAAQPTGEMQPLSRMRQAIARRMTQSKQTQPHYYLTLDIDMTEAMAFRKQLNAAASEQQKVSVNDLVIKACALALERHPKFYSEFSESGLRTFSAINIDIGIAMDEGLIAPAILDCSHKSLGRIAEEAKDLIERAKNGRLTAEEYTDGNFTITNLGAYGVESLIGIINPPQAAILGVGTVMPQPVVRDNEIVIRQVMKVALSADHRVSDGAEGARFIKEIQGLLENPVSLAL